MLKCLRSETEAGAAVPMAVGLVALVEGHGPWRRCLTALTQSAQAGPGTRPDADLSHPPQVPPKAPQPAWQPRPPAAGAAATEARRLGLVQRRRLPVPRLAKAPAQGPRRPAHPQERKQPH